MQTSLRILLVVISTIIVSDAKAADQLEVGSKAPDFSLTDQNEKSVSLADLLKADNVALVFHRSANW